VYTFKIDSHKKIYTMTLFTQIIIIIIINVQMPQMQMFFKVNTDSSNET